MKRLAWLSDVHLNFVPSQRVKLFCKQVLETSPDAVLLGGDIAEAPTVTKYLRALEELLKRPVYFVLGNHDFYRGSIPEVRKAVGRIAGQSHSLCWLSNTGVVQIGNETGLVGHDSWADGRFGSGKRSSMLLNDYFLIREFIDLSVDDRFHLLSVLGDEAAAHFAKVLPEALEMFRSVILLTHVPPFREACWYQGRPSDDDALPHFACKAAGDVIRQIMRERPDRNLTVLCGHTHGGASVNIEPNLRVLTGAAEYGNPRLQQILTAV